MTVRVSVQRVDRELKSTPLKLDASYVKQEVIRMQRELVRSAH